MFNRLYWVALSYLTRPWYIVLLVGAPVFFPPVLIMAAPPQEAPPWFTVVGILFLPAVGLGFQLASQFWGPGSRLMPGFAGPHAVVGVVLAVGLVVVMTARLILEPGASVAGSILLPSALVSVVVGCTASAAAGSCFLTQINRGSKPAIVVIEFPLITALVLFCALFSQTLRQRLLAANDPVTVIVLVFIVAASSAVTIWMLHRLVDWASEAGLDNRRLPEDIFLWGQLTNIIERKPLSEFETRLFHRQERQIEELSHGGEPVTRWGKIQRWRLGNASQWPFFLASLISLIPILIALLAASRILLGTWFNSTPLQLIAILYLAMSCSMVGGQWRLRTHVLPLEILRPTSRASLQRAWMWALLLDVVPGTISFAALEAVVLNHVAPLGMVWSRVPLDFLLLLPLGMCTAVGLASMVVVIRRLWLLVLLGYTLFTPIVIANWWAGYQSGSLNNLGPLDHDWLESFFWFPSLIGLGVAWVMARRWRKLEIGAIS